jgi:hypothetical protein
MVQQTAKQTRRREKQERQQVKQNLQAITNTVLWRIIDNNGGTMNIPKSVMNSVPANATLKTEYDPDTDSFVITAVKPETELVLPEKKLILRT